MEAATARLGRGKRRKGKSYGSEERRLATLLLSPDATTKWSKGKSQETLEG